MYYNPAHLSQVLANIAQGELSHWSVTLFHLLWPIVKPKYHAAVRLLRAICERICEQGRYAASTWLS
jgi:hypothetical protein